MSLEATREFGAEKPQGSQAVVCRTDDEEGSWCGQKQKWLGFCSGAGKRLLWLGQGGGSEGGELYLVSTYFEGRACEVGW